MDSARIASQLLSDFPYTPTGGQRVLIGMLADYIRQDPHHSVFLLKGYAGTGKTTMVSTLVNVLSMLRKRSVLLAPTGRAAKVLAGYSGHAAFTIHKKIYTARTNADGNIVLFLQENFHSGTVFIVDEASMIQTDSLADDFNLFGIRNILSDLFAYVAQGKDCHLILVGDVAQLPPVGQPLSPAMDPDYLRTTFHCKVTHYELTEVLRQTRDSGILYNATRLREQIGTVISGYPRFDLASFRDIVRISGGELEDHLNSAYSRYGVNETVVISRSNKRVNIFNQEIRKRILFNENELSAGDLLMVVRNNYFWLSPDSVAGFIANGDIIEVMEIKKTEEIYGFRFANVIVRMVDYPGEDPMETKLLLDTLHLETASLPYEDSRRLFQAVLEDYAELPRKKQRTEKVRNNPWFNALQVKFAYALTCHKTQGGQWKTVFVDQGYIRDEMLNTEFLRWLYTAVTRASEKLYLVNFSDRFFE
jgi:exodeoxyribonuclease-5